MKQYHNYFHFLLLILVSDDKVQFCGTILSWNLSHPSFPSSPLPGDKGKG